MRARVHSLSPIATALMALVLAGCAAQGPEKAEAPKPAPDPAAQQAITDAKAMQKKAASVGGEWTGVEESIKAAEEALAAGDNAKAMSAAKKAADQGQLGYNQSLLEKAKPMVKQLEGKVKRMNADQKSRYEAAAAALKAYEGEKAHNLASALLGELRS